MDNYMNDSMKTLDNFFNSLWSDYSSTRIPPVDLSETDNEFILEAELPGYNEGDVNVNVDKHVLHISAKAAARDEKKHYLLKERVLRGFNRSFTLPENVDEEKISATFRNGVLTISVPKVPEEKPKKIEVRING